MRTFKIGDWYYAESFKTPKKQEQASWAPIKKDHTRSPMSSVREPTNSKLKIDATSTTAGTPLILSYIISKLYLLFHFVLCFAFEL